ncbi:hypothetical protein [Sporomusa termitida]|uniref:HNH endonuclease n=1 Tax=Sporomusa termitida TaxID=2377 RepID=A0A517E062_9FIRM|nr:hypothetical protein [Sporomusa termitida]QDR82958.1 hypothetical protein SPTER_44090 [Sporomusa termitida]
MICAYCNNDTKVTREHIIPAGIIRLFPECDLAFDFVRKKAYPGEAVIKDVCPNCNGGVLSSLDSYGKNFVETYFLQDFSEDMKFEIKYDYHTVTRWLLKMAFNSARVENADVSWFQKNLDYIMGKACLPSCKVSLFGGLWMNMSPVPSQEYGNLKIQFIREPKLLPGGVINYETCQVNEYILENAAEFPDLHSKYLFRLGAAMFLLFMWDKDAEVEAVDSYEKIVNHLFPYKLFNQDLNSVILECCTDAFNCHYIALIHGLAGMSISQACLSRLTGDKDIEGMRNNFYKVFTSSI